MAGPGLAWSRRTRAAGAWRSGVVRPARASTGLRLPAADLLAAMAVELSFSPWADEMIVTLLGGGDRLPEALGKHNVLRTDGL